MKRFSLFLLVLLTLSSPFLTALAQQTRKKVGVVLSGGGAKGVAHIKALKVIEEAGIPIDYIVGTSMGSIVGGLYAIGYTPSQLENMVRQQDWNFLLSDRIRRSDMSMADRERAEKYVLSIPFSKKKQDNLFGGIIKGQNLANLFSNLTVGYHDSIDFNRLPIPFACVASNVVNGDQIVFHSGELATAMRASMAIPGVFTPVRMDNMVLVDGGMINNYPADVAKSMGADILIGVDVQSNLKEADQLTSVPNIISQIIDLTCQGNHQQNVEMTDVYIKVNVEGYSSASFNTTALDTLMLRGEAAARNQWEALVKLKEKIGISDTFIPTPHGPYHSLQATQKVYIKEITFSGVEEKDKKYLLKRCHLKEKTEITATQIDQALSQLRGIQSYSSASYKLTKTADGYLLTFLLEEKYERSVNLGIRFDSEDIASLLVNASSQLNTNLPSQLSVTARLGKRYAARVDYSLEPVEQRNIRFSYLFEHNDLNIYDKGERAYNVTYDHHLAEFGFSDVWFKNLRFGLGSRFEYFHYRDVLFRKPEYAIKIDSEHFFSYYAQLRYNTFDKAYFPTQGTDVQGSYSVYTDNLAQYNGHSPFSALNASWTKIVPITRRLSVLPAVYGRVLIGKDFPYAYSNALGGNTFGTYMPQQLPFAGLTNTELTGSALMIGSLQFRQRMGNIHYLTLRTDYGLTSSNFFDLLKGKQLYGVAIGYGMDSVFGPLEFSIGYSNRSQKGVSYLNLGYYF